MKNSLTTSLLICLTIVFFISLILQDFQTSIQPLPGEGTQIKEESDHTKRDAWIALLHKTATGENWREIEAKNRLDRHEKRKAMRRSGIVSSRNGTEVLADGQLIGEWRERGSRNQAGRTLATVYDKENDWIYLVSAGGNLWRGKRDGNTWEIINQDLRFDTRSLKMIQHEGQPRLLSMVNKVPFYSDDLGINWESAVGLNTYDNWGGRRDMVTTPDSQYTFILIQEWLPGPWRPTLGIYRSTDDGESYENMQDFGDISMNNYRLIVPNNSNELLVIGTDPQNLTHVFQYNYQSGQLDTLNSFTDFTFGDGARANLTATVDDNQLFLYSYDRDLQVYRSTDTAATWQAMGVLPNDPWEVSMWASKTDPNFLLYGNIECYRSDDGGQNWTKINDWGAYYGDVENKLHADMMYFNEFITANGEPFILISNDGGMNISYDYLNTTPNIGLRDLNISQYYDVQTDPISGLTIFAGSQDQGFQRGGAFNDNVILDLEQVISGDYGHITFSNDGYHLWLVYPGGWISYYDDPIFGYLKYSWELESENETVWIPPLISSPDPSEDAVYLAGGNAEGGPGSHIIRMEIEDGDIQTSQLPFDFKADSGGEVSAMAVSPLNPDKWYVATTNGLFYYSNDAGQSWDVSAQVGPSPQYLYGSSIYPSGLDENVVYFAGSGYSTSPVYRSDDGGAFFTEISEGLPRTVVIEITANRDESMFFAATEAGPYVYILNDNQWYDMSGLAAPAQTYWSVEYLQEKEIVRFGTYGRGIWDFRIDSEVTSTLSAKSENSINWRATPNPVSDLITVKSGTQINIAGTFQLFDLNGRLIKSGEYSGPEFRLSLKDQRPGLYQLVIRAHDHVKSIKIIKQ